MKTTNECNVPSQQPGSAGMPRPTQSTFQIDMVGRTLRVSRHDLGGIAGILSLLVAIALAIGCSKKSAQHFGEPFTDAPRVAIAQLLETPDSYRRQPVRVQGEIERQCPAAGCWLFLRDAAGQSIRVELGDYFPKLPLHVGEPAEVEGEWIPKGDRHEFIGTRIAFGGEAAP